MVRVEVLTVGRELLIGRTLNTNALWVGRRLALKGSMIKLMTTADDDLVEISRSLNWSLSRHPDFLVVIGGLGPTPDDMTLEGVAVGLGRRLVPNTEALRLIRAHYTKRGMEDIEITPSRRKMSVLPEGASPLVNEAGTAPGVRLEAGKTVVFCLPGVPAEMRDIFRRSVEPEVEKKLGRLHRSAVTLKVEGVYESSMAPMIKRELERNPGAYIKSHPRGLKEGVSKIELDVVVVRDRSDEADGVTRRIVRDFMKAIESAGGTARQARRAR